MAYVLVISKMHYKRNKDIQINVELLVAFSCIDLVGSESY